MYESPHCALSADGALKFAQLKQFDDICEPEELISQHAMERVKISYEDYLDYVKRHYEGIPIGERKHQQTYDTVSAVAMDANGNLACATSTGTCRVCFLISISFLKLDTM
jgi:isoaspartyl peptidase/L-asparaginase-like protein (Ntn-hydrolase superfamily)